MLPRLLLVLLSALPRMLLLLQQQAPCTLVCAGAMLHADSTDAAAAASTDAAAPTNKLSLRGARQVPTGWVVAGIMRDSKGGQHPASCLQLLLSCLQHCYCCSVTIGEWIRSLQVVAEGRECLCCRCQLLLQVLRLIPQSGQLLHSAVSGEPLQHICQAALQLLQIVGKGLLMRSLLMGLEFVSSIIRLQSALAMLQQHSTGTAAAPKQHQPW